MITNIFSLFQVLRNSRMIVRYFPAVSYEAATIMDATLQKGRAQFCNHLVTSLREENCHDQVRAARAQTPGQSVKKDEFCNSLLSNVQEELMAMMTNHIITDLSKLLCCGCGEIISFIGNPLQQCTGCETSFRVSISTLIGVAAPALQRTEEETSPSAAPIQMKRS